jgi:RNA polymerase sigma-70 factor (ECF subfamily)
MQAGPRGSRLFLFCGELFARFGQSPLVERYAASSLHDAPDIELVRRARSGERDAFAEIYRRYHAVVYRFARLMSGSPAIGEDVTQETFTVLLRDLHRYRPHHSSLTTYLYGVARNLTRSYLRRNRRFVRLDVAGGHEPVVHHDASRALERSQEQHQLRRVIAELPSRYREVVILCAIHGLSYAEVAAILGTPVGTVRSRLNRGRQAIATRMRDAERQHGTVPRRAARCVV